MKFSVLASGSKGNCYCLQNDNEVLIIEAGVSFMDVKKHLDFRVSDIRCILCSHEHFD